MAQTIFQRYVLTTARPIDAQVLPEVDQLQGSADGVGLRQGARPVDAIQMQQQPAYRVGRSAAVIQQLGSRLVGRVAHVLLESVQQIGQQGLRQSEARHAGSQRGKHFAPARTGQATAVDRLQVLPVFPQVGQALRGASIALVGDIVCRACKVVDRRDGWAQGRRTQDRRHRKVFIVLDAHGSGF